MAMVRFDVDIRVEVKLHSEEVTVFVGTSLDPPPNCTTTCPGHYLLTMAITPRPQAAWAKLTGGAEVRPKAMGGLMLIPPGYAQRCGFRPQTGRRRHIFCLFPQKRFEKLMGGAIDWSEPELCATVDVRDVNISTAARRLAQEALVPGMASSVLTDSIASTVAVDVYRYFKSGVKREPITGPQLSSSQLTLIRDFAYAHSHQDLKLRDFAQICDLSVRQLTRAFRRTTGVTVATHISEIRLAIAKQLLRTTKIPPKVIAARVGFSSVSSFASAFRRAAGVTPRTFRANDELPWREE
jgi:AraC family transcriptional regulator